MEKKLTVIFFLFITTIYANDINRYNDYDDKTIIIDKTNLEENKNNCFGSISYKGKDGTIETKEVNENAKDEVDCSEIFTKYANEIIKNGYEIITSKETFI